MWTAMFLDSKLSPLREKAESLPKVRPNCDRELERICYEIYSIIINHKWNS